MRPRPFGVAPAAERKRTRWPARSAGRSAAASTTGSGRPDHDADLACRLRATLAERATRPPGRPARFDGGEAAVELVAAARAGARRVR
ncbi:hypothetical protein, partial [Rhizomonospora bruguierae]|uniref:hypothetical protein n=1 Tax=Rhizomonospora bruguierae TaxID=1581705 RepID=UPI001BD0FE8F